MQDDHSPIDAQVLQDNNPPADLQAIEQRELEAGLKSLLEVNLAIVPQVETGRLRTLKALWQKIIQIQTHTQGCLAILFREDALLFNLKDLESNKFLALSQPDPHDGEISGKHILESGEKEPGVVVNR